ncbi:GNAT family N-acetyltransferase [Candidatus Protofrankia californiensis]|uniref:GNAT family N-acetyltransferase n=1 Tax=Candidatus Protofrankia californiensis TaxID=1839754 RepID=UPI00104152ED|nr:GNAT family N-acetyltransferase [Candidatus Protofrankia californiensis]
MTIPTLTTPRLTLRPIHNDDVSAYLSIWSDPEFTRYIGGNSSPSRDGIWHAMAGNIGCWALTGVGPWSVIEQASGELVGRAGLWDEPGWPGIEAVWFIGRPWWGRGYATEAATAAISWVFDVQPDLSEVVSTIVPANTPSIRVAERLGMKLSRTEFLHGSDHHIYTISRTEWLLAHRDIAGVRA